MSEERIVRSMDVVDVQGEIDASLPQVVKGEEDMPSEMVREIIVGDEFRRSYTAPVIYRGQEQDIEEVREVKIVGIIHEARDVEEFEPYSLQTHGEAADIQQASFTPAEARGRILEEGYNLEDPEIVNKIENARKRGASVVKSRKLIVNQ